MTILNAFVYWKSRLGVEELITPVDDGCIFNGIVRRSIIDLKDRIFKDTGVKVVERPISIHEIISAYYEKRLFEFIGVASSSNIQSVSRLVFREYNMDLGGSHPFANYLNRKFTDIMSGPIEHPWITTLD